MTAAVAPFGATCSTPNWRNQSVPVAVWAERAAEAFLAVRVLVASEPRTASSGGIAVRCDAQRKSISFAISRSLCTELFESA